MGKANQSINVDKYDLLVSQRYVRDLALNNPIPLVILFLAGYLIMLACSTSVAVQYTAAVAGAVLGILLAIWYDRRVKARGGLSFTIVRVF